MDHEKWIEKALEIRRRISGLLPRKQKEALNSLPDPVKKKALLSPYIRAREKQLQVLTSDADTILVLCGRGWGKNWTGSHWITDRIKRGHQSAASVAETAADVRDDVVDPAERGSGILDHAHQKNLYPNHKISQSRVECSVEESNDARIQLYSGDSPDSLRGFSGSVAWIDELAKMRYARQVYEQINFTLREGNSQLLITTTPRPTPLIKELVEDPSVEVIRGSSWENKTNLDSRFQRQLERLDGTDKGRQEIYAEVLEEGGDLWTYEDISRCQEVPELVRIVIGLDPSISDGEGDEAGIVVAGLGEDGTAYVLSDLSGQLTTSEWGQRVVEAFWGNNHPFPPADLIHAERNQGGNLVETQIESIDKRVAYGSTHTTRSKYVRAEPVHTLYQSEEVVHVGQHAELEDQMTSFLQDGNSPDRVDALCYAVSELLLGGKMSPLKASHVISK